METARFIVMRGLQTKALLCLTLSDKLASTMKRTNKRITVRLPETSMQKLERIARKVAPRGSQPNSSAAVRNLIEKEKL